MTVNLSGSIDALFDIIDEGPDVVVVQEHKALVSQLPSIIRRVAASGWHRVWGAAHQAVGHASSRSGGVAVIVPRRVLISGGVEGSSHRFVRATIPFLEPKSCML